MPKVTAMTPSWPELVEHARWAPSPHNLQTWRLRPLPDGRAELLYDPARTLPATDVGGRFVTVGLGGFAEALSVAAGPHGLAVAAALDQRPLDPGATGPARLAVLSLVPAAAADPLRPHLLEERRTSRLPYDGTPAPEPLLAELGRVAAAFGHRLAASSDPTLVAEIVELNRETLFLDLAVRDAREEIGRWLRFSERDAARRRDGFSPACLGFPGWLLRAFFRAHPLLELPGIRTAARALYGRSLRGTRTIAWIEGPFGEPEECFEAGRMLLRLWLTVTAAGLQLHPFGSIITNADANARLLQLVGGDGSAWLVMRIGRSAQPPRSLRLETDELLVG